MRAHSVRSAKSTHVNHYYHCSRVNVEYAYKSCANRKSHRADRLEPLVWNYVSRVMKNPEDLRAEHELKVLRTHEEYVAELEAGRNALLDSLEAQAPEALDYLTPEERHQWYKLLKLRADVYADGRVEISWAGAESSEAVCETATLPLPAVL